VGRERVIERQRDRETERRRGGETERVCDLSLSLSLLLSVFHPPFTALI